MKNSWHFWPFPFIRNYKTDPRVSDLFIKFSSDPDLKLEIVGSHRITISCSHGVLSFWSSNAFYAWGSEGNYRSFTGETYTWSRQSYSDSLKGSEDREACLPSRWAVFKMYRALVKIQKKEKK